MKYVGVKTGTIWKYVLEGEPDVFGVGSTRERAIEDMMDSLVKAYAKLKRANRYLAKQCSAFVDCKVILGDPDDCYAYKDCVTCWQEKAKVEGAKRK